MSKYIKLLKEISLSALVAKETELVLDDPRFAYSTASSEGGHHCQVEGLAKHTYEVVNYAKAILDSFHNMQYIGSSGSSQSEQLLVWQEVLVSAIWHDYGKVFDYELKDDKWQKTDHYYNQGHIARSAIEWNKFCHMNFVREGLQEAVTHNILSHHSIREWGSPVQPRTMAAWILHLADMASAKIEYPIYHGKR